MQSSKPEVFFQRVCRSEDSFAVTIEGEITLAGWHRQLGGSLTRIAVERAGGLGSFTAWRPALPVVQWSVGKTPGQGSPAQQNQENA